MTISPHGAALLVDLSNLCRDERLLAPGVRADLGLFNEFREAVARNHTVSVSELRAVADRSLLEVLPPAQRRQLRDLERTGSVEFSPLADERLLSLAFEEHSTTPTLVASMDGFDDFRRAFSAIQGSTDRFVGWERNPAGSLDVFLHDMGVHTHHRLSRKEESAELKARRLRRDSIVRRAVASYYRCTNSSCLLAQLWPNRLPQLPKYEERSDRFLCPSCDEQLDALAARPAAVQLIIFLHGTERLRLLVSDGERIVIGRHHAEGCFGLDEQLGSDAAAAVSRRHVALRLEGTDLFIEDLGSRNGTVLRRARSERRLRPGEPRVVGRTSVVALPSGVTIERSGRLFPMATSDGQADESADDREVLGRPTPTRQTDRSASR